MTIFHVTDAMLKASKEIDFLRMEGERLSNHATILRKQRDDLREALRKIDELDQKGCSPALMGHIAREALK
jgi:uncharacterized coiled-coil DUF342 family protein